MCIVWQGKLRVFANVQNLSFTEAEWRSVFVILLAIGPFCLIYVKKLLERDGNVWIDSVVTTTHLSLCNFYATM